VPETNELKALILAGGRGKRLGEYTDDFNKAMLEFGEKHLIEYSLNNAANLAVGEIVIVVGYMAEQIINAFGNRYRDIPVKYVIQREQKGLVHALECSRATIGPADFLLLLADEFFINPEHAAFLRFFRESRAFAACGIVTVDDLRRIGKTYSVLADAQSKRVFRLVEKPKNPMNNIMGTGNILFKNGIFDYIPLTPINQLRQEKELPDLIQCAIDDGKPVLYFPLASTYVNVNTPEDIMVLKEKHSSP
jgi:NDP-sugar pyrophosphorylase family protein